MPSKHLINKVSVKVISPPLTFPRRFIPISEEDRLAALYFCREGVTPLPVFMHGEAVGYMTPLDEKPDHLQIRFPSDKVALPALFNSKNLTVERDSGGAMVCILQPSEFKQLNYEQIKDLQIKIADYTSDMKEESF